MVSDQDLPFAPPAGMVDVLPGEAMRRVHFAQRIVESFAHYGYELVTTPLFELAQVLERGLNSGDRRSLLRFVEPESGSVALMRPDITPQVARIAATRLRERPAPMRLAYQGTIIRKPRGRARSRRQFAQAGVELFGVDDVTGDAEVIQTAAYACKRAGLTNYLIELGQVRIPNAALATVPAGARSEVSIALASKDSARLEELLRKASVAAKHRRDLLRLTELFGDVTVLRRGRAVAKRLGVEDAIDKLYALYEVLAERDLASRLRVDLSELRGQSYYTGSSYQLLAAGPGEPIGSGGRYDDLVGRFGRPMPATGFGLDLEHLLRALSDSAPYPRSPARVVVMAQRGADPTPALTALRSKGISSASLPTRKRGEALAFAKSWGYDAVVVLGASSIHLIETENETAARCRDINALVETVSTLLNPENGNE